MQCYKRKQIKDHFPHLTLKTELCIKVYSSEQFIILKEDLNFSLIFSSHLFFFLSLSKLAFLLSQRILPGEGLPSGGSDKMTTEDGLPLSGPRGLWEEGEGMRAELRVCTGVAVGSCHFLVITVTHTGTQLLHPQGP